MATIVLASAGIVTTMVDDYQGRLADAMTRAGYDIARLAKEMGLSYQAVAKVARGRSRSFSAQNNAEAARLLGVNPTWLARGTGPRRLDLHGLPHPGHEPAPTSVVRDFAVEYNVRETGKVPIISYVQAGALNPVEDNFYPGEADEWAFTWHARPGPKSFALRVEGDSMTNSGNGHSFPEGTIITVDPDRCPKPGDFVVAKDVQTQSATFKRLTSDGARWFLKPLNPAYPVIEIDDPSLRVIGVVIEWSIGGRL